MFKYKSTFLLGLLGLSFYSCNSKLPETLDSKTQEKSNRPQNVILLIGDGMGLSQVSAAFYFGDHEPNFSQFPVIGLSKTSSSKQKITDSAAGATALSTGKKTYNGAIAVDEDSLAIETILEQLDQEGFSSALIATSSITHATPASFYAHVNSRKKAFKIAEQLAVARVDFFAAGGRQYFRENTVNTGLLEKAKMAGFTIDTNAFIYANAIDTAKRYGFLLANDGMPKMSEGRGDFLIQSFDLASQYLTQKEKPFFMMVEGSQIDWGGHANDASYLIEEVLDFDQLLGAALKFAKKDGNTLVIVTADHETGGFTLSSEAKSLGFGNVENDYNSIDPKFSTGGHSATMVPVFAFGPGSEVFSGIYENTAIYQKIMKLLRQH